jgi:hypothetical protein
MSYRQNAKLSPDEINRFRKDGIELNNSKTYMIKFLFNDKWNEAGDPRPFRVKTELVPKLAKDFVGMPYVVNPHNDAIHVRGSTDGKADTTENLLEVQKDYTLGYVVHPIITAQNNVYGIIEVFDEYADTIDEMPKFTSPTITPIQEDADGIGDAIALNINGVSNAGYPKLLAGTSGVCKGGIKECILELMPLASSGRLKAYREQRKHDSLNTPLGASKVMSDVANTIDPVSDPVTPEAPAEEVKEEVRNLEEEVDKINTEILTITDGLSALKETVDTIAQKVGVGNEPEVKEEIAQVEEIIESIPETTATSPETAIAPIGASGKKVLSMLTKEIKSVKDTSAKLLQESLLRERTLQAREIANLLQIPQSEQAKEIKQFVDAKNEDGSYKDLSMVADVLRKQKPIGASRGGYASVPELSGDHGVTSQSVSQILEAEF